ncbi:MAG: TonB-dependent receptor plug domain-containing protein [bacterium]|nr:TonB-dependent receptor plug domain-containing protein [bacterium]
MKKRWIILILLLSFVSPGYGYLVQGKVMDSLTREGLQGVPIQAGSRKVLSRTNGLFSLEVPGRDTIIMVNVAGYKPYQQLVKYPYTGIQIPLELDTGLTMQKIYVRDRGVRMEGSKQKLRSDQINRTTSQLFSDTLKVVQTFPGVVTGNDFSSIMYIRGGEFYETISLIDNILIVNPYIWGGIMSVFNPAFVDSVDFYSGGFSVKYPQTLSGVIDVKNIDGNDTATSGYVDLSAATFELFLQGPIAKKTSSFVFGIRRTQYDLVAKLFTDDKDIVYPFFYDAQSKITWNPDKNNKFYFSTISSYEGMDFDIPETEEDVGGGEFHYRDIRVLPGLNWEHVFGDQLSMTTTLSYRYQKGYYDYYGLDSMYSEISQKVQELFSKDKLNYTSGRHNIELGLYYYTTWEYSRISVRYRTLMPDGSYQTNTNVSRDNWIPITLIGTYVQDDISLVRDFLYFNAGILYDHFFYTKDQTTAYRGGLKITPHRTTAFKLNAGLYTQYPFYSDYGSPPFLENRRIRAEKAWHYIAGWEQDLTTDLFFRAEGYYKYYFSKVVRDPADTYSNKGLRKAWGIDLFLQKRVSGKWDGWLAYSYLHSRDKITGRNDPADFDESSLDYLEPVNEWFLNKKERPHNFSLVFNFNITAEFKISSTFRYYTGTPYTPVLSATRYGDTYVPVYGKYLSERLPDYSRLDVKFSGPMGFLEGLDFYVQTINTLDHNNVDSYYYNKSYTVKKKASMLPFMIIGGFKYSF